MASRPRVLFLAQCLPYPPHSGVLTRTFNVLRELQRAYDVDLVAFSRVKHQADAAALAAAWEALKRFAGSVAEPTPIPSDHSIIRKISDHLRSLARGRPYTYYEYHSRTFERRLQRVLRARAPDLVHLDSLDLHRWIRAVPTVPIACTHHDIESDLLRRRARQLARPVQRHYFLLQANRVERLERELCPRLALNVMMSELDACRLRALAPNAVTTVVPNGTDTTYFQPADMSPVRGRVAFVGPTYIHPNWDAVELLLQEIWPRVRARRVSATLQLIGRNTPEDRARYNAERGVTALGQVPDIRPALSEAACCVVPMRIGGGTRLKILDAWAMGKAIVSTSIGCEGLDVLDGENILVRDTPIEFAEAVLQVLEDVQLRRRLERNARRTASERYSWTYVGQRLRAAYDRLMGSRSSPASVPVASDVGV